MTKKLNLHPDLLALLEQIKTWDELGELVDVRYLRGKDRKLVARWQARGISPTRGAEILRDARSPRARHFRAVRRATEAMPSELIENYELGKWWDLAFATWEAGFHFSDTQAKDFIDLWCRLAEWGRPPSSSYNPIPAAVAALTLRSDLGDWSESDLRQLAYHWWPLRASRRALRRALRAWRHGLDLPFKAATRAGRMSLRGMLAVAVAWETRPSGEKWPEFWERVANLLRTRSSNWPRVQVGAPWLWLRVLYPQMSQEETREVLRGMLFLAENDLWSVEVALARLFSPRGYRQARPFFPEGNEGSAYAVLLAVVFGRRTGEFLRRAAARGMDAHDVAQAISPEDVLFLGREDEGQRVIRNLGRWLLNNIAHLPLRDLRDVAAHWGKIWEELGEVVHGTPLSKIKEILLRREAGYQFISLRFAQEALRFPTQRQKARSIERRWLGSLVVPSPFPLDREWVQGGLRGRFLPRHDPRGIFLGEYTNSCQHPGGVGASAAWHGQENPLGGYFVVEDSAGKIVAMSWAWWAPGHGLCFDNIEAKGLGKREGDVAAIYEAAARDLAAMGYGRVTVGRSHSDLDGDARWPNARPPLPTPTGVYTDAHSQWLLAEGEASRVPEESPYRVRVVWPQMVGSWPLEEVAQACYPEEFSFVDTRNPDLYLVLMRGDKVVGYAAIEARRRYINDVAVLPEHRGPGALSLLAGVTQVILGVAPDEEWAADARVTTSYRLLRLLARAKKVVITADEPGRQIMDGKPMRSVRFRLALGNS